MGFRTFVQKPQIWAKIMKNHDFMEFSVFLRKRWNPAKSGIRGYLPTISWFLGVFLKIIGLSEAHRPWEVEGAELSSDIEKYEHKEIWVGPQNLSL